MDANKFKAGDVRQSVGRFWRVVIDADAKFKGKTNFRYWVPLECQLYTAKQLKFDDPERQFAIPSNFKGKHQFLPQRVRSKLVPKNLGYASLVKSKDDIKDYKKLKSEAQQYLKQKNKYVCAKKAFELARKEMEKCMGIRTKEEIQNYKSQRDIIETQIANAEKKVTDYNSEIQKSEYQLQDAKAKLQALQSKLIEQKKVGDADISLTTQNMCRQQKYINDCEIYTHELRKNLNLVNQAIKCCEKERDKFNELITTSENIRKHYKQDEDYLEARKI